MESRSKVAFRFVILDNSKSMLKRDGHVIVYDRKGVPRIEESTRWEEVVASTRVIANLADLASLPTEIRLLNRSEPVVIGISGASSSSSSSGNLVRVLNHLNHEPSGTTPMCKQLLDVIEQLRCMEYELKASGKVAQLIIMTDCLSTDGNLVDVLKPLEGTIYHLPLIYSINTYPLILPNQHTQSIKACLCRLLSGCVLMNAASLNIGTTLMLN